LKYLGELFCAAVVSSVAYKVFGMQIKIVNRIKSELFFLDMPPPTFSRLTPTASALLFVVAPTAFVCDGYEPALKCTNWVQALWAAITGILKFPVKLPHSKFDTSAAINATAAYLPIKPRRLLSMVLSY
jgi:hypothetical protein